jgi:predicted small secreted protein
VRRLTIVLAASALLLAGCGGGGGGGGGAVKPSGAPLTKAQYQAKLQQIAKDVATGLGSTSSSKKLSKADVDKFVKALHSFADRLAEVNPPAEIKALHTRLVSAMNDLGDEFPSIADKLNKARDDPSAAIAVLLGAKSIQKLTKLGPEFKANGYNLNLNG